LLISLIRFSDINNRVCVGDADAVLLLRILYSLFFFLFLSSYFTFPLKSALTSPFWKQAWSN